MGPRVLTSRLPSGGRILLDSAPLVYLLDDTRGRADVSETLFERARKGIVQIVVSVVSEAELMVGALRFPQHRSATAIVSLLDRPNVAVVPVTRPIGRSAAVVRAEHGLGLTDAIVAATAMMNECTAIVSNDVKFRRLKGISYVHIDDCWSHPRS